MALKLIGAGFGRTGTMSLKAALEMLGFAPCYHMIECFPRGPGHYRLWEEARRGNPDWDAIFEGFAATVDFPACTSYAELAAHYPDAKVLLSVRDPYKWVESTQATIFAPRWIEFLRSSVAGPYMQATIDDYFDGRMHDTEYLASRFTEHVEAVKAAIPAERLLVYQVSEGWGPLCEFLDVPVPSEEFPHINDTAATQEIIDTVIRDGFEKTFGF
jgi:hypothetical protein